MVKEKAKTNLMFVTVTGVGTALYVVACLCLQVPVFENYYLCLGYVVMAVYLYSFGVVSGTIVGTLGCFLYCLLISGLRGMPGWVLGNLFIGIALRLTFKIVRKIKNKPLQYIINAVAAVLYSAIAMLVIKSYTEVLLYSQPFWLRAGKNFYAFAADAFILAISLPICMNLDGLIKKMFPGLNRKSEGIKK